MKFLLNMNVPRRLSKRLTEEGQQTRHVGDIGMAKATDTAILEEAKANQEVVITHDLDYGHLVVFTGQPTASVIILRLRNTHPENLFARIMSAWPEIEKPLLEGAIVVLEDASLRIRRLQSKHSG